MTRVIAIDPGYDRCGIAIVEKTNGREVLVYSECVLTSKALPFPQRLHIIGEAVARVITEHQPKCLAMETLYFSKNTKTAIAVAEARGVITFVAASHNLPLYEYSPGSIKVAVTGSGNADKSQVIKMVPKLITIDPTKKMLDDEYDAIAIGITHLASKR